MALENEKEDGKTVGGSGSGDSDGGGNDGRESRTADGRIGRKQERGGASVRDGGARSKVSQKSQMSLDLLARQLPETSGIPKMVPRARPRVPFNALPPSSRSPRPRRTCDSPANVPRVRNSERERGGAGTERAVSEAYTFAGRLVDGSLANFHF